MMDIQKATVGNVTIALVLVEPDVYHLFVTSADPLTHAFRVTLKTDKGGRQLDGLGVITPNGVARHDEFFLDGVLQHVTVQELQTVKTAAFVAKDGGIG